MTTRALVPTLCRFVLAFALICLSACTSTPLAADEPEAQHQPAVRRIIRWQGKTWTLRRSETAVGPLANYFDGGEESIFVDDVGRLHMRILPRDGLWRASEVILKRRAGYGTYTWKLDSPLFDLDPSVVIGLFTYSEDPAWDHREIDIEFSAWGDPSRTDLGQFVVQPYVNEGSMHDFPLGKAIGPTSHSFTWLPDRIEFLSWTGHGPAPAVSVDKNPAGTGAATPGTKDRESLDPASATDKPGTVLASWSFTERSRIPKPGNEYVHINFYLVKGGQAPSRGQPMDLILKSFEFVPYRKR